MNAGRTLADRTLADRTMTPITVKHLITCLLFWLVMFSQGATASELSATVDRKQISVNETLALSVRYTGGIHGGQPDFSQLSQQFEVLSTSKSNQFRSENGRTTSYTEWSLIIIPKQEGRLVIPSFHFEGAVSDAIEINVSAAPQAPKGTIKDVFIETIINKDSVYVQEQLLLTYRLYYSLNIDSLDVEPLEITNFVQEKLPDARYQRQIKGKTYGIAEFRYALFPQKSGNIEIPALRWDIQTPKPGQRRNVFGFSGRSEIRRLRSESKIIDVKPRPDSYPIGAPWIPAKKLTLTEDWTQAPSSFNPGEPNTRNITMQAEGLMSTQLPQIVIDVDSDAVKAYADQAKLEDDTQGEGFSSTRIESAAIVVSGDGATLPAIRIPWWNVEKDQLEYAEIPQRSLKLSTKAKNAAVQVAQEQRQQQAQEEQQANPQGQAINSELYAALKAELLVWRIIATAALAALLSVAFLWWRSTHTAKDSPIKAAQQTPGKSALKTLKKACKTNDAGDIRSALLNWASVNWPDAEVTTIDGIARRIDQDSLHTLLRQLDASLYAPQNKTVIDGQAIFAAIETYLSQRESSTKGDGLTSFYANA